MEKKEVFKKAFSIIGAMAFIAGAGSITIGLELARQKPYSDLDINNDLSFSMYDNNFDSKTFYVHVSEKDGKTILSEKEFIKEYHNKGIYSSTRSFEKVLFTVRKNGSKIEYETVSFEDLEEYEYEDLMYFIIDENAPESVKSESFVPDCSIINLSFLKNK